MTTTTQATGSVPGRSASFPRPDARRHARRSLQAESSLDARPDTRPRARRESVREFDAGQLEGELLDLAGRLAVGTYELLVLVGEFDARGIWAVRGALSCATWLADLCDIEVSTARGQVRVARALRTHPVLDAAMRDGDLSCAKARVLVAYLDDANVADLVTLAESTPAGRLGAAIAAWSQRHDDPEVIARCQRVARSCAWRSEPDGMVVLTARLTPAAAGAVCAVIDTVVTASGASAVVEGGVDAGTGEATVDGPYGRCPSNEQMPWSSS